MSYSARLAFRLLCILGRPIGGVRPHRIYHSLARRGWPTEEIKNSDFQWHRDRWGHQFLVNPGYHIDRHIIAFGGYETLSLRFLARKIKSGMTCLDLGANLGQMAIHMGGLVGPTGSVYAFEPVPAILDRLHLHIRANKMGQQVEALDLALSDKTGKATLSCTDIRAENQGTGSLVSSDVSLREHIEVRTIRLDDFVKERDIKRLDFVKIDIQGSEPLFIRGATDTLERLGPDLLIEVSPSDLQYLGLDSRDLLSMLEARGYRLFDLHSTRSVRELSSKTVPHDFWAETMWCTRQ